jgi:hypothetical protein
MGVWDEPRLKLEVVNHLNRVVEEHPTLQRSTMLLIFEQSNDWAHHEVPDRLVGVTSSHHGGLRLNFAQHDMPPPEAEVR